MGIGFSANEQIQDSVRSRPTSTTHSARFQQCLRRLRQRERGRKSEIESHHNSSKGKTNLRVREMAWAMAWVVLERRSQCLSRYALLSSPLHSTPLLASKHTSPLPLSATRFNPHPIRLSTSLSTFTLSTILPLLMSTFHPLPLRLLLNPLPPSPPPPPP